jgi:hypothetical protein
VQRRAVGDAVHCPISLRSVAICSRNSSAVMRSPVTRCRLRRSSVSNSRHAQRKATLVMRDRPLAVELHEHSFFRRSARQMQDGSAHVWPGSVLPA